MNSEDLYSFVKQRPFKPFALSMTNGERYEIHHPELIMVGRRSAGVGVSASPETHFYERIVQVALVRIVSIDPISTAEIGDNGVA